MRARVIILLAVVFSLPLWAAANAYSQDLTLFLGGAKPGGIGSAGQRTDLESGFVWGFRVGFGFASVLGFEHTVAFSPDYLHPKRQPAVQDAKGFIYSANFILNIPAGRIVPYGTFGLGLIWQYGDKNLPVGAEFAINYGGGVKAPQLWGPFGLRVDARGYTVPSVLSTKLNIFELSGGLMISF